MLSSFTRRLLPRLAQIKATAPLSTTSVKYAEGEELKMGPWPRTKEERIRAARKYNLIPEDYEPYDEGEGFGDYPKLPEIGDHNKDPYDDFDDVSDLRYYGEPYHVHSDLYRWEKIDPLRDEKPDPLKSWMKWVIGIVMFGFMPTILYVTDRYKIRLNQPWKDRRFLGEEAVLYEFPRAKADPIYGGH